ncbi:GNAT family N-acetyltransferase [Candidatus Enterococcus willemsii]|uniref:N-acetyltransferase domain-containing protein n=1 Tax=Candidatus Enterococcus willemsii TaxID=1857215 RepID=A0ABQ6YX09_9ENTE|nr:GNAT family N-acetyltransferase [Enterococcus sp. CU12B]KAF1302249.1 hypothetical protein BAU17_10745 [Enterococcus sp. CU12B]
MQLIKIKVAAEKEKLRLNQIYEESKAYFQRVEGRETLPPLININEVIPAIPHERCHCLSVYYLDEIIGYLWVFDESPTNIYILHFYIDEKYRARGLARLAIQELEKRYGKTLETAELVVSSVNYLGLKFWQSVGFHTILHVYEPNTIGSNAVELELQKRINSVDEDDIGLLSVDTQNYFLGEMLHVSNEQKNKNLVLTVPEAIHEAEKLDVAEAYFIRLNNEVIGYAALVFDEKIPEKDKRYWLWQLMIDEKYQQKGYARKALSLIIEKYFRRANVEVITLSTKSSNFKALRLYKSFGFQETGEMNGDEVILQKYL